MSNQEDKSIQKKKQTMTDESSVIHLKKDRIRLMKWGIVVVAFLVTSLISFYFISPYRLIDDITVSGSEEVYDQNVLDSSGLSSGESIWENYMNKSAIEERIVQENPQVSQAELTLSGVQNITITIEEYATVAYLANENSYKKILKNGDILDESVPRINASQPILNDFEEGRPLELMIEEYDNVNIEVQRIISEIDFLKDERNEMLVHVFMNDGNEVLVSIPIFSERLNYYQQMKEAVEKETGLFDLEAGAYFVPFTADEEDDPE